MTPPEGTESGDVLDHHGVQLDRARGTVTVAGRQRALTATEYRLLEFLMRQPGQAFTRAELTRAALGDRVVVGERTIDVHVCSLRRKLRSPGVIETLRGVGYRFRQSAPRGDGP
jgi:two-component system phosphate regulon response regulator PhoB